ncbi:MAG: hypothetical protein ABR991_12415 [Terracidiphilus sp.]
MAIDRIFENMDARQRKVETDMAAIVSTVESLPEDVWNHDGTNVLGERNTRSESKALLLTYAKFPGFIPLQSPASNIHSGISNYADQLSSSHTQRRTTLPPPRTSPRAQTV